jgi:hypothetical protein
MSQQWAKLEFPKAQRMLQCHQSEFFVITASGIIRTHDGGAVAGAGAMLLVLLLLVVEMMLDFVIMKENRDKHNFWIFDSLQNDVIYEFYLCFCPSLKSHLVLCFQKKNNTFKSWQHCFMDFSTLCLDSCPNLCIDIKSIISWL